MKEDWPMGAVPQTSTPSHKCMGDPHSVQGTFVSVLISGFPVEPGKPGDLNFICPGPEIAWNLSQKVRKPGQNKKFN